MAATDCQMQPLDLSCTEGRMKRLRHQSAGEDNARLDAPAADSASSSSDHDDAPPTSSRVGRPLDLVEAALGVSSGPARKRFLTKYLRRDRGEGATGEGNPRRATMLNFVEMADPIFLLPHTLTSAMHFPPSVAPADLLERVVRHFARRRRHRFPPFLPGGNARSGFLLPSFPSEISRPPSSSR